MLPRRGQDPREDPRYRAHPELLKIRVGNYLYERGDYAAAIPYLRETLLHARAEPRETPVLRDRSYRIRLAVALYRAGRIEESRTEIRTMLRHASEVPYQLFSSEDITLFKAHKYHELFGRYKGKAYFPLFEDTGAWQNEQVGVSFAERANYAQADRALSWASECSPLFDVPPLLRGYIAAIRSDRTKAQRLWIDALAGWLPVPGPATATRAQYAAMQAILLL